MARCCLPLRPAEASELVCDATVAVAVQPSSGRAPAGLKDITGRAPVANYMLNADLRRGFTRLNLTDWAIALTGPWDGTAMDGAALGDSISRQTRKEPFMNRSG